jgi:hypothetical protein
VAQALAQAQPVAARHRQSRAVNGRHGGNCRQFLLGFRCQVAVANHPCFLCNKHQAGLLNAAFLMLNQNDMNIGSVISMPRSKRSCFALYSGRAIVYILLLFFPESVKSVVVTRVILVHIHKHPIQFAYEHI